MGIIKAIKAKLFADRVEQATQASIDWYIGTVQSVLDPVPALAGEIAKIVINNQDEIERSLVLVKKLNIELEVVMKQYMSDVKDSNPELKKLGRDMELKVRHLSKLFRK